MKFRLILAIAFPVATLIPTSAYVAEVVPESSRALASSMPPVVKAEFSRTQQELQNDLIQAKRKLQALETERAQILRQAQAAAGVDVAGVKMLQDYDLLLSARYADDRGESHPGTQLPEREVDNLNKIFNAYLQTVPFHGRVSLGHARRTLKWGIERLGELGKTHTDPTEKNNSELEIVAKQTRDAENLITRILATAEKLNFKLGTDFHAPTVPAIAAQRAPAPAIAPQAPASRAPASVSAPKKR